MRRLFVKMAIEPRPCTVMCPGFEEWWLGFKFSKLVIFNFYAQVMPRRFLADHIYVHMYVLCKPSW